MKIDCAFCESSGRQPGFRFERCKLCEGHKVLTIAGNPTLHPCPYCDGTAIQPGFRFEPCELCKGIGKLTELGEPPIIGKEQPEHSTKFLRVRASASESSAWQSHRHSRRANGQATDEYR